MRNTPQLRAILEILLEDPKTPWYGYQLVKRTGYQSGTVNVLLERLASKGLISQTWEGVDPAAVGRPPRRYARLTDEGITFARKKLGEWTTRRHGSSRS
jgi:DNA-binding PadR family transcriptional regulator